MAHTNAHNGNSSKPLTIKELAKKHREDPNHTTTDEELRNAQLELTSLAEEDTQNLHKVDDETVIPPLPFEKQPGDEKVEVSRSSDNTDEFKPSHDDRLPNPYDVLK